MPKYNVCVTIVAPFSEMIDAETPEQAANILGEDLPELKDQNEDPLDYEVTGVEVYDEDTDKLLYSNDKI
mgnify:CR=1 FL=1